MYIRLNGPTLRGQVHPGHLNKGIFMRVRAIDSNGDWRFGHGLADYKTAHKAIAQNVQTRVKSFANDWFLDTSANIDWIGLLGQRNSKDKIIREVSRVILETSGIARIDALDISSDDQQRYISINATLTDIYSETFNAEIGVEI